MSRSETDIQNEIRIALGQIGTPVWRNNVGVLKDTRGVPVRFGLANDSKAVNRRYKSADLIGIRPVTVTQEMVGTVLGQFLSIEVKNPTGRTDPDRFAAQVNWQSFVSRHGGRAMIVDDVDHMYRLLR